MDNYDVVIIGGGIHGVGVAQAAAAAGHSVLLLEKKHLAYGTSSRSSKLIHGGLRYLESVQLPLVYECLHERHLLTRLAPELVRLDRFYIPVYNNTSRSRLTLRLGLSMYALLGGLKASTRFRTLNHKQWHTLDGLKQDNLKAVFQYYDGRTDDAALTRAVMQSAIELGAESNIPAEFISADVEKNKVQITYSESNIIKHCQSSVLINATGPWINQVLNKITPVKAEKKISLIQGSHLVLDELPVKHCFYLEAPRDKRAVFLLPWKDRTLLGTTEVNFTGTLDNLRPQQLEKDYLLDVVQHYFPQHNNFKITDEFSGLRVLPSGEGEHFNKPRETILYRSHDRVINIYGGKLTTYRLVAKRIIDTLHDVLPTAKIKAQTENIYLTADQGKSGV